MRTKPNTNMMSYRFNKTGLFLAIFGLTGLLALFSAALVYILWSFSTDNPKLFAAYFGIFLFCLVCFLFIIRLFRSIKEARADEFVYKIFKTLLLPAFVSLQTLAGVCFFQYIIMLQASETAMDLPNFYFPLGGTVFFGTTLLFLLLFNKRQIIKKTTFRFFFILWLLHALYWSKALFYYSLAAELLILSGGIAVVAFAWFIKARLRQKRRNSENPSV